MTQMARGVKPLSMVQRRKAALRCCLSFWKWVSDFPRTWQALKEIAFLT